MRDTDTAEIISVLALLYLIVMGGSILIMKTEKMWIKLKKKRRKNLK